MHIHMQNNDKLRLLLKEELSNILNSSVIILAGIATNYNMNDSKSFISN